MMRGAWQCFRDTYHVPRTTYHATPVKKSVNLKFKDMDGEKKLFFLGEDECGMNSVIAGGEENSCDGMDSFVAAGSHNELPGNMGFVSGESNTVSGSHSASFGYINDVLGNFSHASGTGHVITDDAATAEGDGNIVSAYAAHAEGGLHICEGSYSHAEGLAARSYLDTQHAKASGGFSNPGEVGEAQYTNVIVRLSAEEGYPHPLLLGEEGRLILMDRKMNAFRIMIVAANSDLSEGAAWELKGLIRKGDEAGSVVLVGDVGKVVIARSNGDWDVDVVADGVNGALQILAYSSSSQMIRWVGFVEMVEVAFYS